MKVRNVTFQITEITKLLKWLKLKWVKDKHY